MTPGTPRIAVDSAITDTLRFVARDADDPRFGISGRINHTTDSLTFRIVTRILSTGERSAIAPEKFFDAMMAHYEVQPGGHPDVIHAVWEAADPELVTNLVRFNAALAAGDDFREAATKTFTGRMAMKYGYTAITFGHTDPPKPPVSTANVRFRK